MQNRRRADNIVPTMIVKVAIGNIVAQNNQQNALPNGLGGVSLQTYHYDAMKQILTISLGLIWANLLFAQVQYVQDTSICNSLFLDYTTPEQILSIAPDMSFPDNSEDYVSIDTAYRCKLAVIYDPYDLYISKDSQEYMLAVLYYGMFRTSYRAFYVGRLKDNGMARNTHSYVMTTLSDFHTESGIHIGTVQL